MPALLSAMAPMLVAVLMITQNKAQLEGLAAAMNTQVGGWREEVGFGQGCTGLP